MSAESEGKPTVSSEEIAGSPFAHFVAVEPVEDVRRLVSEAALLVARYAALPIASDERIDLVIEMMERLAPIRFNSRLEPRATIASAWREAIEFARSRFFEAVDGLLRQEDDAWDHDGVRVLLELLVETGLTVPAATAFLAEERLKLDFDRGRGPRSLAPLMALVPNSAGSIFSMLERLSGDRMLRPQAVQSAVRKVAKWDPDNLERALSLFGDQLFNGDAEMDSVRFFVDDIIERAGLKSFTLALSSMDPLMSPALISAAFNGPLSIEVMMDGPEPDIESSRMLVRQRGRILSRGVLGTAAQDADWLLKVRLTRGVTPVVSSTVMVLGGRISFDEELESFFETDADDGFAWEEPIEPDNDEEHEQTMSRQFARMMGVRIEA